MFKNIVVTMMAVLLVTLVVGAFFVVTYSRFITHIHIPAIGSNAGDFSFPPMMWSPNQQ
jgi:hypothetical protein